MTFLQTILETKRQEVEALRRRRRVPLDLASCAGTRGFANAIARSEELAVVAEVKKASPSKGLIAQEFDPAAIARTYEAAGAKAISVLTDERYFQGSVQDLRAVRAAVKLPVLRKDFIIDELQVDEAREAGADAVLLIVAALEPSRLVALSEFAKSLGLDVLVEVHTLRELEIALRAEPTVLGVNNRDLHTFQVSLDTARRILAEVPAGIPVIAESGIHTAADARQMAECGANGILVGESLMRLGNPDSVRQLLRSFQVPRVQREAARAAGDAE